MKTAVVQRMVNDAVFAMVSSCSARVAVQADRCLGGQFACAQVHYVFCTIVDVKKVGCGVFFGDEKGFNLGISTRHRRIRYFQPQPWYFRHDDIMDIDVVVFTLSASVRHIQAHTLHPYIMVDAVVPWFDPNPPIGHE